MFAEQLAGDGIDQPDMQIIPLHGDALGEPVRRGTVVARLDFDAAVQMHRADAKLVVTKRLQRQRPERRSLFRKARGDLLLGGAVDTRVRPALFPAIQVRLRLGERAKALAPERCLLCMADAGFHLPFAIGIADATRQGDRAVMRKHITIERIQSGVVDVRREHAFAQIVEHDDSDGAAQTAKRIFVQLGPDLRARLPRQEAYCFA